MFLYSIAISPPVDTLEEVKLLKQKLQNRIGWYPSCNALAHITFNQFEGGEETLRMWEHYLTSFVSQCAAVLLKFNKTDSFGNGAFFLAPDDLSKEKLVTLMKDFHKNAPLNSSKKTIEPHISIGRQLSAEKLLIARELISDVDIRFVCDNIVIRKFNDKKKQYDIHKHFYFGIK